MNKKMVALGARCELARRRFFYYCNLKAPDFYKQDRKYLVDMCNTLQDFIANDEKRVLIIDLPPRHAKSRTCQLFVEWLLGKNHQYKIMTGSYNETLATSFSKSVRDSISERKVDASRLVYQDIFPNTRIKKGDAAMNVWALEGSYANYLATSPTGTATGFGCNLLILDDVIKNAQEAFNATVKDKHWSWFTNTMLSRLEEGGRIIIVMTRWATDDLAGRALNLWGEENVEHINLPAIQPDGTMLCEEILSRESCEEKKKAMELEIWSANYQQEPIDLKGRLYTSFKTYDGIMPQFKYIQCYADTADTGNDYFCGIVYGVTFDNEAYILDVLYTQEPMEVTEREFAKMVMANKVNKCRIESNNGGRGFARAVEGILKNEYKSNRSVITCFHQSQNKIARILSNASWVMEHIYYPVNWKDKWSDYYDAMLKYQRKGKNAHDDAPDATTGVAEAIAINEMPQPTRINY